uniref:PAN-3 domain-containing protein n=1 Tax=Caenorhabditis japonica TaxID=281687 RepID=A0A8R1HUV7_CAEJA
MRLCFLKCILFSVLCLAEGLDIDDSEPTYKFGVRDGEPASLDGSKSVSVGSWEECVEECENDFECILASQKSPGQCNLFPWNTISDVKKKESGGVGRVAFRLYTNEPACDLNLPPLLHGKTYPLYPNNTNEYLWRIDTLDDGYHITYSRINQDENLVCGNWTWERPYADGCNPECRLSMIRLNAEPGEIANALRNMTSTTWEDCIQECHQHYLCAVVYFDEATAKCGYHEGADVLHFVQKTSADSGKRAAIKVNLNNETCKYTTEQLLNGTYYMADNTTLSTTVYWFMLNYHSHPNRLTFWSIHTYDEHYVVMFYNDELYKPPRDLHVSACPVNMRMDIGTTLKNLQPEQPFCYRPFSAPNITAERAKLLCNRMGLDLLPALNSVYANLNDGTVWSSAPMTAWSLGGTDHHRAWVGLERDKDCMGADTDTVYCRGNQQWQYSNPSMPSPFTDTETNVVFNWGSGQPDMSPEKTCVYTHIDRSADCFLYTAPCNSTDLNINGFFCGSLPQRLLFDIPKYAAVAGSYGFVDHPPYS